LRKRFLRSFLITGLIPLLLMGGVTVYFINYVHRIDVTSLEQNLARQVANEITKEISDVAAVQLDVTLASPEFVPIETAQQKNILDQILNNNTSFTEVAFICLTPNECVVGTETSRENRNPATSLIETGVGLRDRSRSPEFIAARTGKAYVGQAELNNGAPFMVLARPVLNEKRAVIAVLTAKLRLNRVQNIVAGARLGGTGYVYLINEQGIILAHPNSQKVGANVSSFPSAQIVLSLMTQALQAKENVLYKNLDNQSVSGAGAFISDFHWGVIAEWPRAETDNPISTIGLQILIFSLVTLLLIVIFASRMAYKLISPIAYLSQGTSIIGAGNFDYRVNIKTGDELESLARNLNKMAENLKGLEEVHELKLKTQYLSQSLQKEKELSEVKDQFINTVSHQFNTPLSVINWTLTSLTDKSMTPEMVEDGLKKINQSREEILAIVNDLLTLSEIGFSYKKSNTKLIDFQKLTAEAVHTFQNSVAGKNITIEFIGETQNTKAEANEFAIRKVIENLFDNAVTYSHEGGRITIEFSGDLKMLTFKITDRGIGIPKEDQANIFQQFFRAKNAIEKKNVGTGLGLFIAEIIVRGHNGTIGVASEQGKGSTFYFTIPR